MTSRQRGAALLVAALVAGRVLDRFDLPFERAAHRVVDPTGVPPPSASDTSVHRPVRDPVAAHPAGAVPPAADSGEAGSAQRGAPQAPIAINRAGPAELERLPGVGPVLAHRILEARAAFGPFRGAGDLRRVRGIGAKTAARLAPHLRFD